MKFPKNANLWFPAYVRDRAENLFRERPPAKRLWVSITDHYEPLGQKVTVETGLARVGEWQKRWPVIASEAPLDASGKPPCYTFFYPQEEYQRDVVNAIADLCRTGFTDVEVHLHHDHDTPAVFKEKIARFCDILHNDHGLLHHHNGRLVFGFIHGNWALDNSRPDGRWCGVPGELKLLRELGCYADFTMPSFPSPTQSKILNKIYWTSGDPTRSRGFDEGIQATVGGGRHDGLLMIEGPGGLAYRGRLLPMIERGELSVFHPMTPYRVKRWLDLAPRLGEDIFVKLFAHGAREDNAGALLGSDTKPGDLVKMLQWVHEAAQERNLELHWASAYQMFAAVDALVQPESTTAGAR